MLAMELISSDLKVSIAMDWPSRTNVQPVQQSPANLVAEKSDLCKLLMAGVFVVHLRTLSSCRAG